MFWYSQSQKKSVSWWQKIVVSVVTLSLNTLTTSPAIGETVMEKVTRTGILKVGTSEDALPFAYRDRNGNLVGFSIDMLELIKNRLQNELDRDIKLELVGLAPKERIPQLVDGEVDIVCDASSFTWERDREIDFSVSYSTTGTRLLTKTENNFWDAQSLAGKQIGALAKTTNEQAIRRIQPQAEIKIVKDRAEGYQALEQGKIDAFADDGILLESRLQTIPNPEDFQIVGYFSREGIACMVPENNSELLNNVNYTLVKFMQGLLAEKPEDVVIFERWFGAQGILPLTEDLKDLMIENMQLLIDFKDEIRE